jgi:oxygen-dependent protoporphyrinogen oxidase
MPQYNLGHPAKLERIDAALKRWPALALAGNGYRGIGIPDCINSGYQAVEQVLASLAVPQTI